MEWETEKDTILNQPKTPHNELFSFDPNQATSGELNRLGLGTSIAHRIIAYRTKGGKFLVKKDLLKIYGMDSSRYLTLAPYINLPESIVREKPKQEPAREEKPVLAKFDLNLADTARLIKIYGIGSKLARRIVTYREKLGGFVTEDQLKEVYGLDSTVVKELRAKSFVVEGFKPRLLNINTATEKELSSHPYVKYKLAKAIVAYRMQHGAFSSVDELKKITIVEDKNIQQMSPYLSVK
jgi:competence ComEA-like helix-hairpin-helix protein